jgi:competence ComEA-like helix-hairpin-helix protein
MPTKYSHRTVTVFSVFFLLALTLHQGCSAHKSQTFLRRNSPPESVSPKAVNINAAGADELQNIPGIGPVLAKKIIGHRDRYGPFRRPEEILIIDGISEKRFREFRSFILIK